MAGTLREQIETVIVFAERGYLKELGAVDVRHHYTDKEYAELITRFENGRAGIDALKAVLDAS